MNISVKTKRLRHGAKGRIEKKATYKSGAIRNGEGLTMVIVNCQVMWGRSCKHIKIGQFVVRII